MGHAFWGMLPPAGTRAGAAGGGSGRAASRHSHSAACSCLPGCQSAGGKSPWGEAPAPHPPSRVSLQTRTPPAAGQQQGVHHRSAAANRCGSRQQARLHCAPLHPLEGTLAASWPDAPAAAAAAAAAACRGCPAGPRAMQVQGPTAWAGGDAVEPHLRAAALVVLPHVLQHDEMPGGRRGGTIGKAVGTPPTHPPSGGGDAQRRAPIGSAPCPLIEACCVTARRHQASRGPHSL